MKLRINQPYVKYKKTNVLVIKLNN